MSFWVLSTVFSLLTQKKPMNTHIITTQVYVSAIGDHVDLVLVYYSSDTRCIDQDKENKHHTYTIPPLGPWKIAILTIRYTDPMYESYSSTCATSSGIPEIVLDLSSGYPNISVHFPTSRLHYIHCTNGMFHNHCFIDHPYKLSYMK